MKSYEVCLELATELEGCQKMSIGLLLAAVGSLKFGFGALLLFGLLFKSLATTLGDLKRFTLDTFSSYCCKISRFTVGRWIIQVAARLNVCNA